MLEPLTRSSIILLTSFPTLQEPHELIIAGQDKIDITIHDRKTTYLCEVVVMRDLSWWFSSHRTSRSNNANFGRRLKQLCVNSLESGGPVTLYNMHGYCITVLCCSEHNIVYIIAIITNTVIPLIYQASKIESSSRMRRTKVMPVWSRIKNDVVPLYF